MDEDDGFEAEEGLYGDINVAPLVEKIRSRKKNSQDEEYTAMFKQFCRLAAVKLPDHKDDIISEGGIELLLSEVEESSEDLRLYAINALGHLCNTQKHRDQLGEQNVAMVVIKILKDTTDFDSGLVHQCMRTIARITSKHTDNQRKLISADGVPIVMKSLGSSNHLTMQQAMYCVWNLISSGRIEDANININDEQLIDNLSNMCLGYSKGHDVPAMSRSLAAGALWIISTRDVDIRGSIFNKGVVPTMLAHLDLGNAIAGAISPYPGWTLLTAFNGYGSLVVMEDGNAFFRQWRSSNVVPTTKEDSDYDTET